MFDNSAAMVSSKGISERLSAMRQAHPEIETAILLDFRAGTVLTVCSAISQKQETLDGIVTLCGRLLDGLLGPRDHFVLATRTEMILACRTGGDSALALIFDPREDVGRAKSTAQDVVKALKR